jgi:hypothetical protein
VAVRIGVRGRSLHGNGIIVAEIEEHDCRHCRIRNEQAARDDEDRCEPSSSVFHDFDPENAFADTFAVRPSGFQLKSFPGLRQLARG